MAYWYSQVWSSWNIPRHSFVLWLAIHERLATKDRVGRYNSAVDLTCVFCKTERETSQHLFFCCEWIKQCLLNLRLWLEWNCTGYDLQRIIRWIQRKKMSSFMKKVYMTSVAAFVYAIWKARNGNIWTNVMISEKGILDQVRNSVKGKILSMNCTKINGIDLEWYHNL